MLPVKMETKVNTLHLIAQPQKELQIDLRTSNTQNRQKIELYGSLTTQDLVFLCFKDFIFCIFRERGKEGER